MRWRVSECPRLSSAAVYRFTARGQTPSILTSTPWDDAKNAKLRAERAIGFENAVFQTERGDLVDILEHPNPDRVAGQRLFVVRREDYGFLVPFLPSPASVRRKLRRGQAVALRAEADVEDEHPVLLKTIILRRKATNEYR